MNIEDIEEELTLDKVSSGDRPSLYALGLAVSAALKHSSAAVVMVDVLGRVHLMPTESVSILSKPRLEDEELHSIDEDQVIALLLAQGDSEQQIVEYMGRRKKSQS